MGQRNDPPGAGAGRHFPMWGVVGLLVVGLAGSGWAGWRAGLFEAGHLPLVYAMLLGGFFNVALLALFLWAWGAANARRGRIARYNEELRYLLSWSGGESRRRKAGLIRELNRLGAVPASLENAVLALADLKGANLRGCNLRGADLRGVDLSESNLSHGNLSFIRLEGSLIRNTSFLGATMQKAELGLSRTVRSDLSHTDLREAKLTMSQHTGTNFTQADMTGADLRYEVFTDATLFLAKTPASLEFARMNNTICPDGVNSNENGNSCVGHELR